MPAMSSSNFSAKFSASQTTQEPFLWAHMALLLALPLLLVLTMMGLAVGDPVLPSWLELLILGVPAIAIPVWFQWQRPFSPFSLWLVAKPSRELSQTQLKILALLQSSPKTAQSLDFNQLKTLVSQFKLAELGQALTPGWNATGWIAIAAGLFLHTIFQFLYQAAPLAESMAPFPSVLRMLGMVWAIAFLALSSLIWQMGVSVIRILLTQTADFEQIAPLSIAQAESGFSSWGMRSPQLFAESSFNIKNEPKSKGVGGKLAFELNLDFLTNSWQKLMSLANKSSSKSANSPIPTKVTLLDPPVKATPEPVIENAVKPDAEAAIAENPQVVTPETESPEVAVEAAPEAVQEAAITPEIQTSASTMNQPATSDNPETQSEPPTTEAQDWV
jgi:hypothetical protein